MNAKPNLFTPSMKEAERMLDMLDAGGEFTFQTFADADKNKNLVHIYHGSLEAHFDTLARLNGQGAGVFVTVNQTDLQGRTSDNVTRVRALWVDFDTVDHARLDRLMNMDGIPPNLIIESSAGKHHAYWIIAANDEIPINQFTELQKRLIHHFADDGADKAIHDLPRVMRLTGFYHRKGEAFMTQVVHSDEWRDAADLIAWIESLPMPEVAKPKAQAEKPQAKQTQQTQQTHSTLDFKQAKLLARGRWPEIFNRLGYTLSTAAPHEHGACPMCGGVDRFRFDNQNGDGSFICSQGGQGEIAGDGFTLLEHGGYSAADALQAVTHALSAMGLVSKFDSSKTDREWKEPVSQRSELLPVQKLTPEMLPLDIAKYVFDEAERADKMPVDFVAASLLSSLGSVLGTKVAIKPKPFDDWVVVANLWSAIVGTPSMKKTPAYNAGLRPISRLIAKAKEEARPKGSGVMAAIVPLTDEEKEKAEKQLIQDRAEQLAAEQELKELKKELAKVKDEVERKAIILKIAEHQIKAEAEEISSMAIDEEVPEKRYKTDDSSPEALSDLEANNHNGILVFRDELVGLLASLDKDGGTGRAFYLEGWNGTSSYQLDRIMRGAQYIPNHCLTIMGGIQPDKLIAYLEPAIKGLGNDGLMQRFHLLVYPDSEKWSYVDRIPDKDARNAVYSMFESIDKLNESSLCSMGAKGSDDYNKRPYFVFSDQAQELFVDWMTLLHEKKIPNEEHPIIQEHLSKYPKLMTGLALLFHVIDGVNFGNVGPVSKRATEMAIEWCNYLETHARRIYGLVLHSSGFRASILEKKLRQLHESDKWRVEGLSARDIHRKNWKSLTDIQNVYDALDILCGNNWLVMEEIEPTVKGGRPSKRYWINPRIYEMS
ncbi:DUF3987 domain-containing protein [Acinetobacter sp. YH16049]|uniref:DUF3987 domain-containing protein n=1 Tax=Acinetobacter sp. YH16049 TaxID=2601188 RepID=UPI0015D46057|nr:DUF3987 domain-containing protein [Acinetobacter sp. YH16049]